MSDWNGPERTVRLLGIEGKTMAQAAKECGVSYDTVRLWIRSGELQAKKVQTGQRYIYVLDAAAMEECRGLVGATPLGRRPDGDDSIRVTQTPRQRRVVGRRAKLMKERKKNAKRSGD